MNRGRPLLASTLEGGYFPTSKFRDNFKDPDLQIFRDKIEEIAKLLVPEDQAANYKISINVGIGKVAIVPWLGIHSTKEGFDSSPQRGVYMTLLWAADGSSIAASLQRGTDNSRVDEISATVSSVRALLGVSDETFIDLRFRNSKGKSSGRPQNYERAHILGKSYGLSELGELIEDFPKYLSLYDDYLGRLSKINSYRTNETKEDAEYQAPKKRKRESAPKVSWVRDKSIRDKAISEAGFKCAIDETHATFILEDGTTFMEGHHLIPLEFQDEFEQSLDFVDNVVCLCPTCHRKIHYAKLRERLALVELLFERRCQKLTKQVDVTLSQLKNFYSISS